MFFLQFQVNASISSPRLLLPSRQHHFRQLTLFYGQQPSSAQIISFKIPKVQPKARIQIFKLPLETHLFLMISPKLLILIFLSKTIHFSLTLAPHLGPYQFDHVAFPSGDILKDQQGAPCQKANGMRLCDRISWSFTEGYVCWLRKTKAFHGNAWSQLSTDEGIPANGYIFSEGSMQAKPVSVLASNNKQLQIICGTSC